MKRFLYGSLLLILAILTGCSNKNELMHSGHATDTFTLKVKVENTWDSRTMTDESNQVFWTEGDRIGVFVEGYTAPMPFTYSGMADGVANFTGNSIPQGKIIAAYYPYDETASLEGTTLTVELPGDYDYLENHTDGPMIGQPEEENTLYFKHLCGLLKVTINDIPAGAAKLAVESSSESSQDLYGKFRIADITAEAPVLEDNTDDRRRINYRFTTDLTGQTRTFYVPLPPASYPLEISLRDDGDNKVWSKTTTVTIKRRTITELPEVSGQDGELQESGYLDMNLDDSSVQLTYETSSGNVNVTYADGTIPTIRNGKSIVLPNQYDYDIRVIEDYEINGNQVSLKTRQGNMCDLFRNTEFTLTTNAELAPASRSGKGGTVITPSEVTLVAGNSRHIIYQNLTGTRADYNVVGNLYSFSEDYKGSVLYEEGGNKLYWDKCSFNLGLNSVFYFKFGEDVKDEIKKGDLKEFSFYLDGNVDVDFLLKYLGEQELNEESDRIIKKNVTPTLELKFIVGNIPVIISLDTHLGERFTLNARSELHASAGFNAHADARLGMSWTEENGIEPIREFNYNYEEYDPTFSAEGTLSTQVSYFPQIEIFIYKFIGPWMDIIPYLQQDVKAGLQVTGSGNNYIGWENILSAGVDTRMGLNFDFFFFNVSAYKSDLTNLTSTELYRAPYEVSLVSPQEDLFMTNEEIEATFKVTAQLGSEEIPCPGAFVQFEGEGLLSNQYAISDENGLVTVKWTPDATSTRGVYPITAVPHKLSVKVIGSEGEAIAVYNWKILTD